MSEAHEGVAGSAVSMARARARRGLARAGAGIRRGVASVSRVLGPLLRAVGRLVGPVIAIVSPAGWLVLALGVGALLAGLLLGWQEAYFIGIPVLAALACCAVFLIGRSTYAVQIELSPPRVVMGERAMGRLLVTNAGTRSLLATMFELPVGAGRAEFPVPGLEPGQEHEELFAVPTERRAVIVAGPVLSVRGDQLGLLRRAVRWTDPVDLFVHPVTVPITPSAAGLVRDLEGQTTKKITNNDLAFHALRPYEPGDDRRYVHWRTSARVGQLMVRQFEETRRSQLTIVLSENEEHYADADEFELAVSVVASIGAQVVREGTRVAVVAESRMLRSHTPQVLLDDSCRLGLRRTAYPDARGFARAVTARLPPPSVAIVVSGSRMPVTDHRAISLLFPSDATVLAITADLGASPALGMVSALRVATVGALGDLAMVLTRAGES